ncbi:hypothetical protein FHG87_022989 [Trinorchestia longiramus]|nr:hypothetical protein FHG87_022989 [Trinorchestia longiramus]
MKVKLAAQVLSNSHAAALDTGVAQTLTKVPIAATNSYCKKMNDIFDVLNSVTSKCSVPLRKPISINSDQYEFPRESFSDNYAKIASASLMRAPLSANCQTVDDQLELTVAHFLKRPRAEDLSSPPITLNEEDMTNAKHFNDTESVGTLFELAEINNAAAYLSGYVAMRLNSSIFYNNTRSASTTSSFCVPKYTTTIANT